MIGAVVRLTVLAAVVAWVADSILRRRAGGPPPPVRVLAVIDAPVERVWDVLVDVEGQPRWMHDMKSVRMDQAGPVALGSRGEATVRMFGVSVTDPVTISVLEPPTRFGVSHEGLFAGAGIFDLEPGADGTTTIVRWEETLAPPVLPHLGAALTAPVFQYVFQADAHRLKRHVEAGG